MTLPRFAYFSRGMCSYPLAADYQAAIQHPSHCFTIPDLRAGNPVLDKLGLPYVESGQFAYVFRLRLANGRVTAIRCFARDVGDREHRYDRISQHLTGLTLPALTAFEYERGGVRVEGRSYPILQMDWVDGMRLHNYIASHVDAQAPLQNLSAAWLGLVLQLESCQIAHGDLQHGNILVGPRGTLRLVDYDGMWVPGMDGLQAIEEGHPNYQHPGRSHLPFSLGLDRFSALVIYTAILALVERPSLWPRYDSGENILFRAIDFARPERSQLFA